MAELEYVRTDRNGTQIFHDWTCPHCGGAGSSDNWRATGRTCWECGGTGKRRKPAIVKRYTPEHEAKLGEKAAERVRKRQAEENEKFLHKNGFAEDGTGFVFAGDTRHYKDKLKAGGARWNNYTHWIAPQPIGEFPCVKVAAEALCDFGEVYHLDYDKCMAWVDANNPW